MVLRKLGLTRKQWIALDPRDQRMYREGLIDEFKDQQNNNIDMTTASSQDLAGLGLTVNRI